MSAPSTHPPVSGPDERDGRDRRKKGAWWRPLFLVAFIGLAVHVLLPQLADVEASVKILRELRWWALALAVAAQGASYWGSGYLLRELAALGGDRLSAGEGVRITLAANSVGLVAGGQVGDVAATYRWARVLGVSAAGALLASSLPNLFNTAALAGAGALGLVELIALHRLTPAEAGGFVLSLGLLCSVAVAVAWAVRHRERGARLAARLEAAWARLRRRAPDPERAAAAVTRLAGSWDALRGRGWKGPLLGSAVNVSFDALTLYLLFVAASHPLSPGVLLAGYGLPILLGKISILPGGIGVVEGTMTALFTSLGVETSTVILVVLAYRGLSFWIPTLIGFPLVLHFHHRAREAPDAAS